MFLENENQGKLQPGANIINIYTTVVNTLTKSQPVFCHDVYHSVSEFEAIEIQNSIYFKFRVNSVKDYDVNKFILPARY